MPGIDRRLIQHFEWPLVGLALALALVGAVNLISAAPGVSDGIPPTAVRQLSWIGLGLVALLAALVPDYRTLERVAIPVFVLCAVLLAAVLVFGPVVNGSQRWIVLGPVRFQPSELAKLGIVLFLARLLRRHTSPSGIGLADLAVPALAIAVPVGLTLREPDLGTALIQGLVAASFLVFARIRIRAFAGLGAAGLAAAVAAWSFFLHDYQKERVFTFLDPDRDPLGTAYHAIQSQIAIGSGGLLGKGYLRGPQSQLDFLPEQQTDFVFSVLAEEWGFLGGAVVLVLYLSLFVRGLMIARSSRDLFGTYLAVGVVALLFWPCAINVAMVLGMVPVVGVPLPLLSYGGSSLVTAFAGIGLLANVSMRRYVF
ncbi:MAG: rod shape-determining protein RodA [Myxococcota bacterium]|nr:rod shape-determining protein RodA [Myxococcota bacterium]